VDGETAQRIAAFRDTRQERRRLFAELFGTFLLVVAAPGGAVVAALSHGAVSRSAEVAAARPAHPHLLTGTWHPKLPGEPPRRGGRTAVRVVLDTNVLVSAVIGLHKIRGTPP
jgi:hypothetical protein